MYTEENSYTSLTEVQIIVKYGTTYTSNYKQTYRLNG